MKEIHFYERASDMPDSPSAACGWSETEEMIAAGRDRIDTVQMGLLSTRLITDHGYRIFVHPDGGRPYELRLGSNDCTDKEIRAAHNLFRMWQANAFSAD